MHYFTFADKDATIYEVSQSMNTGLDEILEIRKDMNADGSIEVDSRIADYNWSEGWTTANFYTVGSSTYLFLLKELG